MAYSTETFVAAGGNQFAVNMDYLSRDHISVTVNGVAVVSDDITWVSAALIELATTPTSGHSVVITRTTPLTPVVTFTAGSISKASLNSLLKQALFAAQEVVDAIGTTSAWLLTANGWDASAERIINVAAPSAGTDAVNKTYADALSVSAGNVTTPSDPADDDKFLMASGGTWSWVAVAVAKISDMTAYWRGRVASSPAANVQSILAAADYAAIKTLLGLTSAAETTVGTSVGNLAVLSTGGKFDAALIPSAAAVPTGVMTDYFGTTAPSGWKLCDGSTIGSALATADYSSDDLEDLFTLIWDGSSDTYNPVSGGRGGSAAADWAANKNIQLPDLRGRVEIGLDNMGGSAASRVTAASTNGGNSQTLGADGGAQTHTLTVAQTPAHTHTVPSVNYNGGGGSNQGFQKYTDAVTNYTAQTTSSSGSGSAHSNTQPWVAVGKIIKE